VGPDHHFPADLVPKLGELGCSASSCPRSTAARSRARDGGAFTSLCIAIEELGRVDQSIGITLSAGVGLGINPILTYGTDEQKERFLPDLVAGRALAGFGLTEPDAGSTRVAPRPRPSSRRPVGGQRRQGLHHQLRHRHHLGRHGHRPHRHRDDGRPRSARS
jgi:alkylation response protein AidB-like acyl-CoA dehydrogenase